MGNKKQRLFNQRVVHRHRLRCTTNRLIIFRHPSSTHLPIVNKRWDLLVHHYVIRRWRIVVVCVRSLVASRLVRQIRCWPCPSHEGRNLSHIAKGGIIMFVLYLYITSAILTPLVLFVFRIAQGCIMPGTKKRGPFGTSSTSKKKKKKTTDSTSNDNNNNNNKKTVQQSLFSTKKQLQASLSTANVGKCLLLPSTDIYNGRVGGRLNFKVRTYKSKRRR